MALFVYVNKGKIKTMLRFGTAVKSPVEVLKDRVSVSSEML